MRAPPGRHTVGPRWMDKRGALYFLSGIGLLAVLFVTTAALNSKGIAPPTWLFFVFDVGTVLGAVALIALSGTDAHMTYSCRCVCGAWNPTPATVCSKCGASLQRPTPDQLPLPHGTPCPKCGAESPDFYLVCPNCNASKPHPWAERPGSRPPDTS